MNLIDCSYYYAGPLQIENARPNDDLDNNAFAVQEAITAYIERYQDEFLRKLLGKAVAETVKAYLDSLDDEDYEGDESVEELCKHIRLPFAHYIYYKIAGDVNQNMTVTGLMKLKSSNENQPVIYRMVRVWNDMVSLNRDFVEWAESSEFDVFYRSEMITCINQFNL